MLDKLKGAKFLEQAKRLNKYMESVDTDLKKIAKIMNENALILNANVKELDVRMARIEAMLSDK